MNAEKNLHVCAVAYFREFRKADWAADFLAYSKEVSQSFRIVMDYFSIEFEGENNQFKTGKLYKLSPKNEEKLITIIEENFPVTDICFYKSPDADVAHHANLIVQISSTTRGRPYRKIYTQFSEGFITSTDYFSLVFSFFNFAEKFIKIDYAFYTYMNYEKLPFFYFNDIFVSNLSKIEVDNLAQWISNDKSYPTKLRGIFEGNILGDDYKQAIENQGITMQDFYNLFEPQLIKKLNSGKYFFNLSENPKNKNKIINILSFLLIKPTGNEIYPP